MRKLTMGLQMTVVRRRIMYEIWADKGSQRPAS